MRQGEAESDFTPKRLARLLNFTAICRSSANAALSHHPKLQSPPRRQSPEVLQCRVLRQPRRTPHPVQRLPLLIAQLAKQESPGSQARNIVEVKDGTPKKGKQCNCKNSRCLKLYCECFAAGIYCNGCKCLNCFNNVENEAARQEAVGLTLDRNPNAFRPKIATSPQGCLEARQEHVREAQIIGKHSKGCHCKRSGCLKKYCECFQANILCSENCKCMDCKNFEGSEERRSLSPGNHNSVAYMQQAANAAINQAISSSGYRTSLATRKRKSEEHPYRVTRGQVAHSTGKLKQENHQNNAAASLTLSAGQIPEATNATVLGSPKLNYKYPLAGGILTSQAVNDICSLFVLRSHEVIKELSGKVDIQGERRYYHTSNTTALHIQEGGHDIKGHEAHKISTDDYSNGNKTTLGTNGSNLEDERPALLETDLMCHEKEMEFTELIEYCKNKSKMTCSEHESSHLYTEQEKLILTMFRDFLNRLVTSGDTEENQQDRQIVEKGEINQRRRTELLVEGSSVDKYRPQSKSLLQNLTW